MLRSVKDLMECRVVTERGQVGQVKDLYFDDETGRITFIVAGKKSSGEEESVMVPLPEVSVSNLESRQLMLSGMMESLLSRRFPE